LTKKGFTIPDIINLEYFIKDNSEYDKDHLAKETARLFEDEKDNISQLKKKSRYRQILRIWLDKKYQSNDDETKLPGKTFINIYRIMTLLVIFTSFLFGVFSSLPALSYEGKTPVNIGWVFLIFVMLQVLLIIFLPIVMLRKRLFRNNLLVQLLENIVTKLLKKIPDKKFKIDEILGKLKNRTSIYGNIPFIPLFLLVQLFGIFFNIGIWLSFFAAGMFKDIAFGWQSTFLQNSETVYKLVSYISMPWSWFFDVSPTIEQIEGSRIVLKDGITSLNNTDMASWINFFLLSVFV